MYSEEAKVLARNSYDATTILVKSIHSCERDKECAKNKIYNLLGYKGVSGEISISIDGASSKNNVLKTVKNGKFIRHSSLVK